MSMENYNGGVGASGEFIGYNREAIEGLRDVIFTIAEKASATITDTMQAEIVDKMANLWYAPDAVTFFNDFATRVSNSAVKFNEVFDSFRQNIENAGVLWAEQTGGDNPSLSEISSIELTLSVASIQDNHDGNIFINADEATALANKLELVKGSIKTSLATLANELDVATAFIGGGQSGAIETCFAGVMDLVNDIFKYLTEDSSDGSLSLATMIKNSADKYTTTASTISSTDFSSSAEE